uniref:Kinesin light chain n=1 Tax=Grammatophora oceanica TaxID=210454 RepID=A0A7S1Y635_9STRA|mmetsp:Transcript_29796/g.43943  ORF Transcript_29796/g.43943 Transcript_29796/m.43943 type:complete len:554 (+) Transcript_29796:141-1802(+)
MNGEGEADTGLLPTVLWGANSDMSMSSASSRHQQEHEDDMSFSTVSNPDMALMLLVSEDVNRAAEFYEEGRLDDALEALHLSWSVVRNHPSLADNVALQDNLAIILNNLSHIQLKRGRYEEALDLALEALDKRENVEDELTATLWFNFGFMLWKLERNMGEAHYAMHRSLQILQSLGRDDASSTDGGSLDAPTTQYDKEIATVSTLLLMVEFHCVGDTSHPIFMLLQILNEQRSNHGFEHPSQVKTLCSLGKQLMKRRQQDDTSSAAIFYREALRIQRHLGASSTELFSTLAPLGQALQSSSQPEVAMEFYKEALQLKGESIGSESKDTQVTFATVLYNVGMIQSGRENRGNPQRRARALHSFRLCYQLRKDVLGKEHPGVASALHNMGTLLLEDGKVSKSMKYFQESLRIRQKSLGPDHPDVASSLRHIGRIYQDQGKYQQSLGMHDEALRILRLPNGDHSSQLIEVLLGLGHAHRMMDAPRPALRAYEEAVDLLKTSNRPVEHIVRVLNIIGNLLLEMSDVEEANKIFAEASQLSGDDTAEDVELPCAAAA